MGEKRLCRFKRASITYLFHFLNKARGKSFQHRHEDAGKVQIPNTLPEYQALLFWLHAAQLLIPGSHVARVTYEAPAPKAFDDVVVEYDPPVARGGSVAARGNNYLPLTGRVADLRPLPSSRARRCKPCSTNASRWREHDNAPPEGPGDPREHSDDAARPR
jgi:hypothetical protein